MRLLEIWTTQPFFQALGWALIHSIWQGTAVALVLASAMLHLRRRSANVRYAACCAAMILMLALPVATFYIARQTAFSPMNTGQNSSPVATTGSTAGAAIGQTGARAGGASSLETDPTGATQTLLATQRQALNERLAMLHPWLVAIWVLGVFSLSLRVLGGWALTQRMKKRRTQPAPPEWLERIERLSQRLRVTRPVRVCVSALAEVPAVIGWLRPVILIPASALTGLSTRQLEALLAHELAHVRRYDYLVNLLQTVIETLLFYHPAVWWVSRQARVERENCCDDLAVAACGDVLTYARALADLEQLRTNAAPQLAIAADGGSLLSRIHRLVETPPPPSHRSTPALAGFIVLVAVFIVWAGARTTTATLPISASPINDDRAASATSRRNAGIEFARETGVDSAAPDFVRDPQAVVIEVRADGSEATATDAAESNGDESIPNAAPEESAPLEPTAPTTQDDEGDAGDIIDELAALGYKNVSVDKLVALKVHGVTPAFIREMKALGIEGLTLDALVAFKVHGVTTEFVREMKAQGLGNLSDDDLVAARVHGVTPQFARDSRALLKEKLDMDELVAMRVHNVTPALIGEFENIGFKNLTVDDMVAARVHGVTPDFARSIRALGFSNVSLDELVGLRVHGITVDFVKKVRARGFDDLTVDQLMSLKNMNLIKDK